MTEIIESLSDFIKSNILAKEIVLEPDFVLKEVGVDSFSIVEIVFSSSINLYLTDFDDLCTFQKRLRRRFRMVQKSSKSVRYSLRYDRKIIFISEIQ